jgi:formate dehydrogenase iron-sulfur subunit
MSRAVLVDTTICTGCRGCQVACKEQHDNPAEETVFFARAGGYQNPAKLSPATFSLVTFRELDDDRGEPKWVFVRRQCMHCLDPGCVAACPVGALRREPDGTVTHDPTNCLGCMACEYDCPFGVPTLEEREGLAFIRKCNFCLDRVSDPTFPAVLNEGHSTQDVLDEEKRRRHRAARSTPACVSACPTGALKHGDRDELLREAHGRIRAQSHRYVNHVYGEREAGGTAWLYLSSVPFDRIGLPTITVTHRPRAALPSAVELLAAPPLLGLGALLGGFCWLTRRREEVAAAEAADVDDV